jgi:cysteine desulfurase
VIKVYLDHAATTPVFPAAVEIMSKVMLDDFGNPSSMHQYGQNAKAYLDKARSQVADLLNAQPEQVYFTSGGTESDNLAIFGCAWQRAEQEGKRHLITSAVEHHAVLESCEELAKHHGFSLTVLPVDGYGMVAPESLQAALRPDTALVSIMHANNEVGTINPIRELAALAHAAGAVFHTDAVQTVGKIPCDVQALDVDLLTCSSHKINGPKGVGALYKKPEISLYPRIFGGSQERRLRSGTENLPGIVGFGQAAEITRLNWRRHVVEWQSLRNLLVQMVLSEIKHSQLNGHPTKRLPHNAHLSFDFIEGEALLVYLNMNGIACSAGSACSSGVAEPSHVLAAMHLSPQMLASGIRFSLGLGVDLPQIEYSYGVIRDKVALLRSISPFYPGK